MAWQHRAQNALSGGLGGAGTGAGIGAAFGGPTGALIGGGIGFGFGTIAGLLTDTEMQELADRYARGEIDPEQERIIADTLKRRYDQLRINQNADLAARGLTDSSIAADVMSDIYTGEREALADALAQQSMANQGRGVQMQRDIAADRANTIAGGINMAYLGMQLYRPPSPNQTTGSAGVTQAWSNVKSGVGASAGRSMGYKGNAASSSRVQSQNPAQFQPFPQQPWQPLNIQ